MNTTIFILISIMVVLLCLPIAYIAYTKKRTLPYEYLPYYFEGRYNAKNIIGQIERLELLHNRSFSNLKTMIQKYESITRHNLDKKAGIIDIFLLCIMLGGQKRLKVYLKFADPFLKFIVTFLVALALTAISYLSIEISIVYVLLASLLILLIVFILLSFLISIMEIYLFILRKNNKPVGGLPISIFALKTLFSRKIKRKLDPNTGLYSINPNIVYTSSNTHSNKFRGFIRIN